MPNTIRLHRVVVAKPEKFYCAFLEADAVASWSESLRKLAKLVEPEINQ